MERVAVFIDGNNLYHNLRSECGNTRLDYSKFVQWLCKDRKLVRAYYYNAPLPEDSEQGQQQQTFFSRLKSIPYFEIRLGRLEPRGDTLVEKGVDIALAVDMVSMAFKNHYDVAVLVSSDGDFSKAVTAVKDSGKHVEVACFSRSRQLREVADKVIEMDCQAISDLFLNYTPGH